MSPELDQRITQALAEPICSGVARALLAEVREALSAAEASADRLEEQALSPILTMASAKAKRRLASDARFDADRLDAAMSALARRVCELEDSEEAERKADACAKATAERDAVAAEIAERYPAIVRELTSLAKRIAECDAKCAVAGVYPSAEEVGRGCPGFRGRDGTIARIGSITLPMPDSYWPAWGADRGRIGAPIVWRGLDA